MDLTSFVKKRISKEEEIIIDNDEVKIIKNNDEIEFFFKKKEAIEKYQNFLFMSPTHAIKTDDENKSQEFFELSQKEDVEGLMFKSLKSDYKPGLRTGAMSKLKETKEDLDVVIVGAEHGRGKRAGYYSSFIIAVKNDYFTNSHDKYLEIGKVSSGIKELEGEGATMMNLTKLLKPLKISEKNGVTRFEPKIVIQIKYQEIQKSTTYNSGFALRFPRIVMLREDKNLDEINSVYDVESFA